MKKTKIVATIGPATESKEMLEKMLKAGMNVMRLNFSHGDFNEHQNRVNNLREVMQKTGMKAAILQDLCGPKIRIGDFYQERVQLKEGDKITITTEKVVGDEKRVSINYSNFPKEVKPGDKVMVDDGKKKFEVLSVSGSEVVCKILVGGDTKGRRGVNLPDSDLSISSLTEKDKKDLEFGVKNKVDYVALSFVRRPADIIELREILKKKKCNAGIIAKIETPQAVENIDEIISLVDGIMIARGDLAVEVPYQKVPGYQKMMIEKCNNAGKPVITATQMLESMIKSPVATRAEVSDVANAIMDGTDALMLSEETTLGQFPIEAVTVMSNVANELEANYPEREITRLVKSGEVKISDSITSSVVKTSHDVGAKAIVAFTGSGFTARMISRYKPACPILALSPDDETTKKMSLVFGCIAETVPKHNDLNEVMSMVREVCLSKKIVKKGDKVVVAGGVPFNTKGLQTNMMLVLEI